MVGLTGFALQEQCSLSVLYNALHKMINPLLDPCMYFIKKHLAFIKKIIETLTVQEMTEKEMKNCARMYRKLFHQI